MCLVLNGRALEDRNFKQGGLSVSMRSWLKRKSPGARLERVFDNLADINAAHLKFWSTLLSFPQRLARHCNSVVKKCVGRILLR